MLDGDGVGVHVEHDEPLGSTGEERRTRSAGRRLDVVEDHLDERRGRRSGWRDARRSRVRRRSRADSAIGPAWSGLTLGIRPGRRPTRRVGQRSRPWASLAPVDERRRNGSVARRFAEKSVRLAQKSTKVAVCARGRAAKLVRMGPPPDRPISDPLLLPDSGPRDAKGTPVRAPLGNSIKTFLAFVLLVAIGGGVWWIRRPDDLTGSIGGREWTITDVDGEPATNSDGRRLDVRARRYRRDQGGATGCNIATGAWDFAKEWLATRDRVGRHRPNWRARTTGRRRTRPTAARSTSTAPRWW